jgi:hypothetical protein
MPVVVLARLGTLSCNLVFRLLKLEIGGDVAEPWKSICSYRPKKDHLHMLDPDRVSMQSR